MKQPGLTPRLKKLADLVGTCSGIWDVGTDHGKLPVWLLTGGRIPFAVASDINKGPLDSALKTAKAYQVDATMQFVLCDGLNAPLLDSVDTITIAGMGGDTIRAILQSAPWVAEHKLRLLLQPMSSIEELREFLYSGPYTVHGEYLVRERDKLYVILDAQGGGEPEPYDFADTRIGKHLDAREPDFVDYANREVGRLQREMRGADECHMEVLRAAIRTINERKRGTQL